MFISSTKEILKAAINMPGVSGAVKQTLVGPAEGWEGWVMRLFTLTPGGYTPRHTHPWPHINYIVSGKGNLFLGGKDNVMEAGSVAYIPGDAEHQFQNRGEEDFSFICIVPVEGDK